MSPGSRLLGWNVRNPQVPEIETRFERQPSRVTLGPDRNTLLCETPEDSVTLRRLDGTLIDRLPQADNRILARGFDAGGGLVVYAHPDGDVEVLHTATGNVNHLQLHDPNPWAIVAVAPRGGWIASGYGADVKLWQIPEGTLARDLSHDEFMRRLRGLTNIRAVKDQRQPSGYGFEASRPPPWNDPPHWLPHVSHTVSPLR